MASLRTLPALVAAAMTSLAPAQEAEPPAAPEAPSLLAAVPAGAVAFAETSGLNEVLRAIRESAAVETILASDQFAEFQTTEEFSKLRKGVNFAELVLRMDLWEAGEKLFGGRTAVALYPREDRKEPDMVFLVHPADPKAWSKQRLWTNPVLGMSATRIDRKRFNRRLKVYQTKGDKGRPAYLALHKRWLAVSTDLPLLEKTISLQVGDPEERQRRQLEDTPSLATSPSFRTMAERVGGKHLARVLVDTGTISKAIGGRLGLPGKLDNPLASFVAGGVLELAAHSTIGTLTLDTDEDGFLLEAGFNGDPTKLDERFQVYFSDHPASGTAALPEVPGLIGGFTVYRDVAGWYRSRDAFLEESVLPGFDKFETGIGNLLPGKDLGADVLPLLGNNLTFVSALQSYEHLEGRPGVQLPGFAFVIDLDEAEQATDIFQLFFQTLLSVLNIEAGNQNRQPWLLDVRLHGTTKVTTARYLEAPKGDQLPTVYNFLPASARVGDRFIVSSSLELCENLIEALAKPDAGHRFDRNLLFEARFQPLAGILAANSDHFVAKRVTEGRTATQAEADVELFLTLLRQLDSFSLSTSADRDGFLFKVRGKLNAPK